MMNKLQLNGGDRRVHDAKTDTIRSWLASGFETDLFEAALKNLNDRANPLRFNNFAYSVRETVRHVLKRLAPDQEVLRCPWYKNETGKQGGITRKQRAYFAVQGGLSDGYVKNSLLLDSEADHKALSTAIDGLNKYTHIEPSTFGVPEVQVERLAEQTLSAVADVLETVAECRRRIIEHLETEIDAAAVDEVLSDSLVGIDELASHFSVQEVSVGTVKVTAIDHECIHIEVKGAVDCILQFGSNSDVRRGDGAEIPQTFAFSCRLFCPVDDPDELSVVEDSVGVDTRAWHDARYGRDEYE
jgi:Predicted pPIWI-associating nuclease